MIPFSILDLCPIGKGFTAADALRNSVELAKHAEKLGYLRFWLAEHHSMPGIASAATSIVIGHVAAGTRTIRVGSGGIMLPNHSPLVIAEQFGTLASLYPGRIDLGLGRAPGSDQAAARALRRPASAGDAFPQDVVELMHFLGDPDPTSRVHAVPGEGTKVPIWLLGSSLFSAQLAAALGLPFAFASHFAPDALMQALAIYRSQFQPSAQLDKPYSIIGVNVFAADTDAEARRQFTSHQQAFINLRRGAPGQIPAPIDDIRSHASAGELSLAEHSLKYAAVGAPEAVESKLEQWIRETEVDELMVTGLFHDHQARLRSIEITAEIRNRLSERLVSV